MFKTIVPILLFFLLPQFFFAQLNTTFQSQVTYTPKVSDVWGYASGGQEFAIVGLQNGVNIQDITDPANPIDRGTASGVSSTWRDIKTYGNYAYITNETSSGIMVIDLSNVGTTSITGADYWNWEPNIPSLGDLTTCHNLYIDGAGYAYLSGCDLNSGGILYVDLFTDPANPSYVDKGAAIYAHDVFVDGNRMYTSEIYAGKFGIYDISDKANTLSLATNSSPGSFTHNAWTDGSIIFTTDEIANGSIGAYDINDLNNITPLDEFKPLATINTGVIPHNVHLHNGYVVTSHYSDGVVVVDASEPDNMIEVANYDTYTGGGTGFNGAWGAYPFLPSGNILISDRTNGLFVVTPAYVRAARLEGIVTDLITGDPILNVMVTIDDPQANFGQTDFLGEYKTGIAAAGTFDVTFEAVGYTKQIISASISNGVVTALNVVLKAVSVPLELTYFDVEKNKAQQSVLSWGAVNSFSTFNIEIEKSTNGAYFNAIGKINEEGVAGDQKEFRYVDRNAAPGTNYYRLKMIDPDNSFTYSEVKNIVIGAGLAELIQLFPNPLADSEFLNITIPKTNDNVSLRILNAQGAVINQLNLSADSNNQLSKQLFVEGLNFIVIENEREILKTSRIVR